MKCQSCGHEGMPNLEETGPHTKALCRKCGKYIKMVGKDALEQMVMFHEPETLVEYTKPMNLDRPKLKVWTAQYNYSSKDRVDITVKSAKYPWNVFAPSWKMVMDYKRTGDRNAYTEQYNVIIDKAFTLHSQQLGDLLKSDRTITLVCFCRPGDFCHRVLLARHFEALGATYYGER